MNNLAAFRFRIDMTEIVDRLGKARHLIEDKVVKGVETLSIATHAFILGKTNEHFAQDDFKRKFFLGLDQYGKDVSNTSTRDPRVDQTAKHVRWIKINDGLWVVELDEKAQWLEEGRPETFMGDWLLKPGAKGVKRAKDGSLYRAIPFKQTENGKVAPNANPILANIVKDYAKENKINLKKIEKDINGNPKIGVIRKLDIRPADAQGYAPGLLYSKPRTAEDAAKSGLKPHEGIFKLAGAIVTQRHVPGKRKGSKGSVKKETMVFRVISTKHKAEGRWMYPEVQPFNVFPQALDWANKQWENIVQDIERSFQE